MQAKLYDVAVVGAGNAGLIAALAASEAGCSAVLIEAATFDERGGNSRFASGIYRIAHSGKQDLRRIVDNENLSWSQFKIRPYEARDYIDDIRRASSGYSDAELIAEVARGSQNAVEWLKSFGVSWKLNLPIMLDAIASRSEGDVNLTPGAELIVEGGGKLLVEKLFNAAEVAGVEVLYGTSASRLVIDGRRVSGVILRTVEGEDRINARSVILASGGFEASPEARARYLGPGWDLVKVRGTRFNTGVMLERALDAGAASSGHWSGAHAVPVDAAAPAVGSLAVGDSSARYSYPFGVLVNVDGLRFLDEGSDDAEFTYATIGRQILAQPHQVAFQIFDAKTIPCLDPRYSSAVPEVANTITELAERSDISVAGLTETLERFNAVCGSPSAFDPTQKDGLDCHPSGQPPKSNWALPIGTPPFYAYAVACGITFTFGGLAVNRHAEVLDDAGRPIAGLYAVGEIAGGFFAHNVPSGAGLARGAVCGRVAGERAAAYVRGL